MALEGLFKSGFVPISMSGNNLCQFAMSCRGVANGTWSRKFVFRSRNLGGVLNESRVADV